MNESDIPIDIHTLKLQDWLVSRRIAPKNFQPYLKNIRNKISNALQDMPSNAQLIELLSGTSINYYHCQEIVNILKDTEKDTKSVFGTYGSQRMKDWQEIIKLYEKDNIYLAETSQIYVRNVNYEIPGLRKQMIKLEQQSEECLKRVQDLAKPEAQLLNEHSALLQKLDVKGQNLREEFIAVIAKLPEMYDASIQGIGALQEGIELYGDLSSNKLCLPILHHLIIHGNTTVYQYIHKEAPLSVEQNPIKVNISTQNENTNSATDRDNEIDFGCDDNGGTSSSISAEIIDFGDFSLDGDENGNGASEDTNIEANNAIDIDWGIETKPADTVEINFDISLEEFDGIVVEGVGMDGGIAKGEQAYTLLDSPTYHHRFLDELFELEAFLKMRIKMYELNQSDSSNLMLSLLDSLTTHDCESISKMLSNVQDIIERVCSENLGHLFQMKHSPKYADLLASKLTNMHKAVEKIRTTKEVLKQRAVELKAQKAALDPVLNELFQQTKILQNHIEKDISKRYKNRVVNLFGGV